jgi:hypothetical protein
MGAKQPRDWPSSCSSALPGADRGAQPYLHNIACRGSVQCPPFVPECEMGHDPPGQHDEYARETL